MNTFLQTTTVGLTLLSTYFLSEIFLNSPRKIVKEVTDGKLANHTRHTKHLAGQTANARVGVFFLLISSIIQAYRIMTPITLQDFEVSTSGGVIGILTIIALLIFGTMARNKWRKEISDSAKKVMEQETIYAWDDAGEK